MTKNAPWSGRNTHLGREREALKHLHTAQSVRRVYNQKTAGGTVREKEYCRWNSQRTGILQVEQSEKRNTAGRTVREKEYCRQNSQRTGILQAEQSENRNTAGGTENRKTAGGTENRKTAGGTENRNTAGGTENRNTYSNLSLPTNRNSLSTSQRKNTARLSRGIKHDITFRTITFHDTTTCHTMCHLHSSGY